MFGVGRLGLVKDFDGDGVTAINQSRKADQCLPALADFQQLGQLAEGPGGVALVGGRCGGGLAGVSCCGSSGWRAALCAGAGIACYRRLRASASIRLRSIDTLAQPAAASLVYSPTSTRERALLFAHSSRIACQRCRSVLPQLQIRQRLERTAGLLAPFSFQRTQVATKPQHTAMLVHDTKVHEEVRRQHVDLDVGFHHIYGGGIAHQLEHGVGQAASAKALRLVEHVGELGGGIGQRHQTRARALVQRLDESLNLLAQHAGHQPFAALLVHLVQHKQRHGDGQAVVRVAGLVQISRGAVHAAQANRLGETGGGDAGGLVPHQLLARQPQERALAPAIHRRIRRLLRVVLRLLGFFAVPVLKAVTAAHIGRQLLVVKGVDQLVVHQHVLAPRLVFQVFHLLDQLLVRGQKGQRRLPLVVDQGFADKDFARADQIDAAVVHLAAAVDHDAVERGALQRHHLGLLLFPMRVQQLLLQQMAAHLLQPRRLDGGNAAPEQARGFHQLGRHNPAPRFLHQMRARMRIELDAARAQVFARGTIGLQLAAHIAQEAGQHGEVQLLVGSRCGVESPFVLRHHGVQLGMDVFPLAHAAHVDEVLAQQLFVLAVRDLVLAHHASGGGGVALAARIVNPLPQLQVAAELAFLVVKLGVLLVGLLLRVHGAVAHVLHT